MYCDTVDLNFPNMRKYLGHCRIYPFKYIIYFSGDGDPSHEDYWISRIYHLPAVSEEETIASVIQIESEKIKDEEDFDKLHEHYIKMLKTFGRYSKANSDEFFIGNSGFNDIIDDRAITKSIYKLLKNDLEDLFRK